MHPTQARKAFFDLYKAQEKTSVLVFKSKNMEYILERRDPQPFLIVHCIISRLAVGMLQI